MNEDKLIDQMVQGLGIEVKSLLSQAQQGQLAVAAVERVLRDRLWHFGAQALGTLLEGLDRQLVKARAVHDRRTRTVVSLFGPLDITRSHCRDGSYPLDEALGLLGQALPQTLEARRGRFGHRGPGTRPVAQARLVVFGGCQDASAESGVFPDEWRWDAIRSLSQIGTSYGDRSPGGFVQVHGSVSL